MRPHAVTKTLAVAAACMVTLAACSSSHKGASPVTSSTTSGTQLSAPPNDPGAALQQEFVSVVNKVRPLVVEISTSSGLGSGVVYDDKGDIVTNDHVVGTAQQFQVTFFDGQTVPGTLVGAFPPDDLAVIKVNRATAMTGASLADSSQLQVGDIAIAIGNPLGLASSVTEGIVSFNGRTVGEGNGIVLPNTVQTSAAINPGNSGGALVNLAGQLIGIPTLAAIDPELGESAAPGIGFAIPSNTVKLVVPQLIANGRVLDSGRASLDISGGTAVDTAGQPVGAAVTAVQSGGPAAKAGIKPGDVITKVGDQPTPTLSALQDVLADLKPGQHVTLTVIGPDGSQRSVSVTLGNLTG